MTILHRSLGRWLALSAALLAALLARPALAAPQIQHWETSNGLRVYFVQAPELPMLDARLVFDAGSARDGASPGIARLTNGLLDKGAADLNADAIADRFAAVGAQYGAGALRDMAWVSLRSLSDPKWLEPALSTFVAVLSDPRFPVDAVERARRQTVVALRDQAQDPGELAENAFYKALYAGHPYASPPLGTAEGIAAITREDIRDFYRRHYVARNGVLALVGSLDRMQAERIAERLAAGLVPGAAAPALPAIPALTQAETVRVPFPSEQAHIFVGEIGMRRGDDDYFPLYVGNHVLGGGGFTSRLMNEVRVKRGLAYSVYSYFLPMAAEGPFIMGMQTRVDQAEGAVDLLKATLGEFVAKGPAPAELEASKKNITGGFPLRTASNSGIVEHLAVIGFYGLPLDYLDSFTARVSEVTPAKVRDAFSRRVHPDRLVTIVVGGEAAAR